MAFARVQGRGIAVLHSVRSGRKVRQLRVHLFGSFEDARRATGSDGCWESACQTMEVVLGAGRRMDREALRADVLRLLEGPWPAAEPGPVARLANELCAALQAGLADRSPRARRELEAAAESLAAVTAAANAALQSLANRSRPEKAGTKGRKVPMQTSLTVPEAERDGAEFVEELFEVGLEHYDRCEWEEARTAFARVLQHAPEHVDALVHLGNIEELDGDQRAALELFIQAERIARPQADALIASQPDLYRKRDDIVAAMSERPCPELADCREGGRLDCGGCERNPAYEGPRLFGFLEFKPFFRAMLNKAGALFGLRRYEEAIATWRLARSYDDVVGTSNRMGLAYYLSGDLPAALEWYVELFWPESFYVRSLLLLEAGDRHACLEHLIVGFLRNAHVGRMLLGTERPDATHWLGDCLPPRLEASEFVKEHRPVFARCQEFRSVLACVVADEALADRADALLRVQDFDHADSRDEELRKRHMPLVNGFVPPSDFADEARRVGQRLDDPADDHWSPARGQRVAVVVREHKAVNWLVAPTACLERTFFLRPQGLDRVVEVGERATVVVTKSWRYRRSLFVSGTLDRSRPGL